MCTDCTGDELRNSQRGGLQSQYKAVTLRRSHIMPQTQTLKSARQTEPDLSQAELDILVEVVKNGLDNSDSFIRHHMNLVNSFLQST
jgi:hypothetical protein